MAEGMRSAAGLSQEALGKALGVDESTIRKWEICEHRPTGENVRRIQLFFRAGGA